MSGKKLSGVWYLLLMVTLLFVACSSSRLPSASPSGKLVAVATFSILADLAQNVAGDTVEIKTLVGAESDTHTFEPSPSDSVAIADAALILENGASFESWLDELYNASRSTAKRVVVSDGIALRQLDTHEEEAAHEGHAEVDPHVWHDVHNVMQMVKNIRDALVAADPNNADQYQKNAEGYLTQLQELDQWVVGQVATIPAEARKLVTTHDTFGYFAKRYGFDVIGSGLSSISTESADPAAADVVALIERVKAEKVTAIFVENVSNPELMERIASEAGVQVAPPLYTDALGDAGSGGDTYIRMMRYNVTTIVDALSQGK